MNKPMPNVRELLEHHFQRAELRAVLGTDDAHAHRLARAATGVPLAEVLARPGKELRARFVEHAFAIAKEACRREDVELPRDLPYAVELLHCGSLIVDDIQDDAHVRRGGAALHRIVGIPVAINAGNFLYFLPMRLLSQLEIAPLTRLAMLDRITHGLLRCHHGQGLDLSYRVGGMSKLDVRAVVQLSTMLKTGALIELSCALGALAAEATPEVEAALATFGCEAGIALQMLDDLSGFFVPHKRHKAIEDLLGQRPTWAWAFIAEHADDATFEALQTDLAQVASCPESVERLIDAMRAELEGVRTRPCRKLHDAVGVLRADVGERVAIEPLLRDVRALEQAYV
jgi:geranylgeranyl pyrophosphate synthase